MFAFFSYFRNCGELSTVGAPSRGQSYVPAKLLDGQRLTAELGLDGSGEVSTGVDFSSPQMFQPRAMTPTWVMMTSRWAYSDKTFASFSAQPFAGVVACCFRFAPI